MCGFVEWLTINWCVIGVYSGLLMLRGYVGWPAVKVIECKELTASKENSLHNIWCLNIKLFKINKVGCL